MSFGLEFLSLTVFPACVLGSAVICVDVVLRRLTHHKSFQIANSNNFLSASLCLSAGVMVRCLVLVIFLLNLVEY